MPLTAQPGYRAIASPARKRRRKLARTSSSWMTAFRIHRSAKISASSPSMLSTASAMARCFQPALYAIIMMQPAEGGGPVHTWLAGFTKPILHARLAPTGDPPRGKLVAFAGLARPEKFFDTLESVGADVEEAVPYGDHHPYSNDDLAFLAQLAKERGAQLITTEKDAARLSPEWRARVAVLPVTAKFDDEAALDALLEPIQSRMKAAHGEA
jgi:hypothetical protein